MSLKMSKAEYEAHQRRHGFIINKDPVVPMAKNTDAAGYPIHRPSRQPKGMNKTEREFSMILEAQRRQDIIARWDYEGITLRWGGLRYTPDFVVTIATPTIPAVKFIEVKGAFIYDDALVKFKAARAHWTQFEFQLWQKAQGNWFQLL